MMRSQEKTFQEGVHLWKHDSKSWHDFTMAKSLRDVFGVHTLQIIVSI